MDVVVYTQYYRAKSTDRQRELDECLQRNLNHPGISRVMLFLESDSPPLPEATVPVEVITSDARMTYAEWFRWVRKQNDGIALLLNSDIYLDEGLENLQQSFDRSDAFLALTRYNPGASGLHLNDYPHWTQDVWGVRADAELPESLLYESSFPLGFPGCDNRIAYVMWSHGFHVRNPCYHLRSVHLQASTARAYDKTNDRLYGGVSYVHPSLTPSEDAELEFTLWTRSDERPAGVLINQQAIEEGVHQLRHGEADVAQRFLDQQQFTGLSWVHEAVGSAHLEGDLHPFASEDTIFLTLPALLNGGLELRLHQPTRLQGLSIRLPKRAAAGYRLELQAEGEGEDHLHLEGDAARELKPAGERRFWQPEELKNITWNLLRLKLVGPQADQGWRPEEGAELVLFGEEGSLSQAKSLNVIAEDVTTPDPAKPACETEATAHVANASVYKWQRRTTFVDVLEQGYELHRFGARFRVLHCGDELVFEDRFWPSVGVSSVSDMPCDLNDARGLFLWGFGQPTLELRPDFIADSKRYDKDVNFWQYPCRTEGDAFAVHRCMNGPQIRDGVLQLYLGLPWATWIDRKSWPNTILSATADRLQKLRQELKHWGLGLKVHSVCQHILWRENLHLIKGAGVECLWLSHKPPEVDELEGVELSPWHLYPVNAREADRHVTLVIKPTDQRPWLASFIGAHMNHYITDVRQRLQAFKDLHRFHIQLQDEWHFNPIVYGEQVGDPYVIGRKDTKVVQEDTHRYNKVLSDSQFSLCPAGAGPNSLRLWESLSVGSIPVILSDQLVMPDIQQISHGKHSNWEEIVLFHPESDLDSLPSRLEGIAIEEVEHRSQLAVELIELVNRHTCLGISAQRELPKLKRETAVDSSKPRIVIPMYGPADGWFWRSRKHGFYNVVLEWYLRGYVTISFGWRGYFWWGDFGEILLMERDNVHDLLDRKKDPPRWQGEVPYKHAFFFNQYHLANGRNHTATYFTYAPDNLEKVRATLGRLHYKQRNHRSIFAGSIENETQEFFRNRFRGWEEAIEIYSCADKLNHKEPNRYGVDEYLQLVATSKFGVSFRGNGPKCFRELEYLAFGTPLIITEGIEVNYPNPLEEGVHYFRAHKPEDIQRIVESTSEETWEQMSQACWQWFENHGTLDRMFEELQQRISQLDLTPTLHRLVRIATSRELAEGSLAARSLAVVDPLAQWIAEDEPGETPLELKADDLVVNQLPFVGQENAYIWKVEKQDQRSYADSITNSDLEAQKHLLEILGLRFRNFKIVLVGPDGSIPIWDRLVDGTIVLNSDQESAILQTDYDWTRCCSTKYVDRQEKRTGPGPISLPILEATLYYLPAQGPQTTADLSDKFNDYYAMHGALIPEETVVRICKLWVFNPKHLERIEISIRGTAGVTESNVVYEHLKW